MKRLVPLCLMLIGMLCLAGCSTPTYIDDGAEETPAVSVSVTITDGTGKDLFSGTVDVKSGAPTVYMATVAALKQAGLSYSEVAGSLSDFGGIADVSLMAWQCVKNGSAAQSGDSVAAGDTVVWTYTERKDAAQGQSGEDGQSSAGEQPAGSDSSQSGE